MRVGKGLSKRVFLILIFPIIGIFILSNFVYAEKPLTGAEKKQQMIKDAKESLEGTVWEINLKQMTQDANKDQFEDTLRFSEGRISSDKLVKKDFTPTNFTVRVKNETNIIWETMQTSADKENGIAFWRGEIRNEGVMRGVLSWHIKENKIKDYSFRSKVTLEELLNAPPPPVVVEEVVEAVVEESAEPVPAAAPVAEAAPAAADTKQEVPVVEKVEKAVEEAAAEVKKEAETVVKEV